MAPRVRERETGFHEAVTQKVVLDTLPYIAALQPPASKPKTPAEPAPRIAATANMARAAKLEAPLMPRGLKTDLTALAKAALAGLGIPFALVVLRSLVF